MKQSIYIESAESERKHRKVERLARELRLPVPGAMLELQVTMPGGEVVHHHKQRSHSWTRNVYNLLFAEVAAVDCPDNTFVAGKVSFKDTGGTIRFASRTYTTAALSASQNSEGNGYRAAAGSIVQGIVVGTDGTAESFEDYRMNAVVAHGAGAGQLAYAASPAYAYAWNGGTLTLTNTLYRYMNNNSGGAITIRETGLYQEIQPETGTFFVCMCRDVLAIPVDVPNMGQLKVTYTINLVYPV